MFTLWLLYNAIPVVVEVAVYVGVLVVLPVSMVFFALRKLIVWGKG